MASPSRFSRLRRILAALLLVVVAWSGVRLVMRFVHKGQQRAVLQRMGLDDPCADYDYDGYVSYLLLRERDSVSTEALGCLKEFTRLRWLTVSCRHLTDGELANLDGLHNVEVLFLLCRGATDDGLKSLAKLDHLERLILHNGPGMTGEGLAALPEPSRLTELHLSFVTDGGMRAISRFRNLRKLSIGGPQLGLDGLKDLLVLSKLEKLTIRGASVDRRVIETMVGKMTWLKDLWIVNDPMTMEDAFELIRRQGRL